MAKMLVLLHSFEKDIMPFLYGIDTHTHITYHLSNVGGGGDVAKGTLGCSKSFKRAQKFLIT
jgi:hypothetical protein